MFIIIIWREDSLGDRFNSFRNFTCGSGVDCISESVSMIWNYRQSYVAVWGVFPFDSTDNRATFHYRENPSHPHGFCRASPPPSGGRQYRG